MENDITPPPPTSDVPSISPDAKPARRPRKRAKNPDATGSREEALLLLHEKRGDLIKAGKLIAQELCAKNGKVTSRDVVHAMRDRGLLDDYEGTDHWLGAIFANHQFRLLPGEVAYAVSKETNIHKRRLPVWGAWPGGMKFSERRRINKAAVDTLAGVALREAVATYVTIVENPASTREERKAAYERMKMEMGPVEGK